MIVEYVYIDACIYYILQVVQHSQLVMIFLETGFDFFWQQFLGGGM